MGGYAALSGLFFGLCVAFAAALRASGRELPESVSAGDLALGAVATQKVARLVTKDRVTSTIRAPFTRFDGDAGPGEVSDSARGRGLRRAIGELIVCPFCIGQWIASAFTAGLIVAPRATRWIAFTFAAASGADFLQFAHKKAEDSVSKR